MINPKITIRDEDGRIHDQLVQDQFADGVWRFGQSLITPSGELPPNWEIADLVGTDTPRRGRRRLHIPTSDEVAAILR